MDRKKLMTKDIVNSYTNYIPDNSTVDNLKKRLKEIRSELDFSNPQKHLENELYEIQDTLKKLGVN
jgi:hypothetical protein